MNARHRLSLEASDKAIKAKKRRLLGLRRNALTISITELITGIGSFLTTPFWPLYALSLGASMTSLGLLQMISGLLGVFLMVPGGYLADKIGRKRPLVIGGFVAALGSILQALAQDWVQLIPGMILSAGLMMTWPARQSIVADDLLPNERVTGFATFFTFMMLPSAIMPMISGYIMDQHGLIAGMRASFIVAGILTFVSNLIKVRFLKETRTDLLKSDSHSETRMRSLKIILADAFEPLSIRAVKTLFIGCSGVMLIFGLQQSFSAVYAVEVIGLSKTEWGLVSASMGLVSLFIRIPLSRLVVRLGERRAIIISQFGRSAYPTAFALSINTPQLIFSGFGYTVAFNLGSPAFQALLTEVTPFEKRGRVYGLFGMIWGGIASVSPTLAALMWEFWGAASAFHIASIAGALSSTYLLIFHDRIVTEEQMRSTGKT